MNKLFLSTFLFLLISARLLCADPIDGVVISVADGDTVTVLDDVKVQHKIRLWGIDAPEKGQDFGNRSRQTISEMVFQKTVKVDVVTKDHYGRSVGKVYAGDLYVNLEMVKKGMAWWYRQYAKHDKDLEEAERQARGAKLGLWSMSTAMPPWEWRKLPKRGNKDFTIFKHEGPYWVTSSSGKTHNSHCQNYKKTKGYECLKGNGVNCKICGGNGEQLAR